MSDWVRPKARAKGDPRCHGGKPLKTPISINSLFIYLYAPIAAFPKGSKEKGKVIMRGQNTDASPFSRSAGDKEVLHGNKVDQ